MESFVSEFRDLLSPESRTPQGEGPPLNHANQGPDFRILSWGNAGKFIDVFRSSLPLVLVNIVRFLTMWPKNGRDVES